jgi:asparagine synthetase B (glutamine-hydrolysing)
MTGFYVAKNASVLAMSFVSYFVGHTTLQQLGGYDFIHSDMLYHDSKNQVVCLVQGTVYNCGHADGQKCVVGMYIEAKRSTSFIRDLKGDFALVIFDFERQHVVIATDLFATKPLWISMNPASALGVSTHASTLRRLRFG